MREQIRRAVAAHLPSRKAVQITARPAWIRQLYDVVLDDGSRVLLKLTLHEDWIDTSGHEARVTEMLGKVAIALPKVLAVDQTRRILPHPFVIVEHVAGERLGDLLRRVSAPEAQEIYRCVGALYGRMHSLVGPRSGVWIDDPSLTLPVSPNQHMFQAEIVGGSGQRALAQGLISRTTYERLLRLWQEAMPWLQQHTPRLIHYSAFPWSICLAPDGDGWHVTRLNALGDTLWWDAASDLAMLRWPPGMAYDLVCWEDLLDGYVEAGGLPPDLQRMRYYLLLHRLCAAMDVYMAPEVYRSPRWQQLALAELDPIMDAIEG